MVGDGVVNPFMWLPYLRRVCLYERAYSLLSLPPSGLGSSKLVCRPHLTPRYSVQNEISVQTVITCAPHTPVFVWVGTGGADEYFATVFSFENWVKMQSRYRPGVAQRVPGS
jgi:hypothetical protein